MLLEKLLPVRSCGLCASLLPKEKLASDEENFKFNNRLLNRMMNMKGLKKAEIVN
jgi:hypothetical protein